MKQNKYETKIILFLFLGTQRNKAATEEQKLIEQAKQQEIIMLQLKTLIEKEEARHKRLKEEEKMLQQFKALIEAKNKTQASL